MDTFLYFNSANTVLNCMQFCMICEFQKLKIKWFRHNLFGVKLKSFLKWQSCFSKQTQIYAGCSIQFLFEKQASYIESNADWTELSKLLYNSMLVWL